MTVILKIFCLKYLTALFSPFLEKRTVVSGGFSGFNPALLSRRDSSLKLKQNLEQKQSDAMKDDSKEDINGEKQLQMSEKEKTSSEHV